MFPSSRFLQTARRVSTSLNSNPNFTTNLNRNLNSAFRPFSVSSSNKSVGVTGSEGTSSSSTAVPTDQKHADPFVLPPNSVYPNHSNRVNPPADVCRSPVKNDDIKSMYDNPLLKKRKVPIQLRQTGDGRGGLEGQGSRLLIDTRSRKGPYWHLSQEAGSWCYSIYNKMYHPRAYIPPEEGGLSAEYKYLTEHVTMWNVAVERQICIKGPDASNFVDYVVTRKASKICPVGKCKYVLLCNTNGGILNDPILLRVAEDEWWFSLADSDIGLYLQGVNHDKRWDVEIDEIDVSPVQIQGPKASALMDNLCGDHLSKYKYYDCRHEKMKLNDGSELDVVVTATGFSGVLGYEIYLKEATKYSDKFWNHIIDVGENGEDKNGVKHNLKVIAVGHHGRIESGMMSYMQDIDWETTPYECGMSWQVDLKREDDFIGKKSLKHIKDNNLTTHKLCGIKINENGNSKPLEWYNADFYHVFDQTNSNLIGYVTSAWYSPSNQCNIAIAMLPIEYGEIGTKLGVALPNRYSETDVDPAEVVSVPFKKKVDGREGRGAKVSKGSKL